MCLLTFFFFFFFNDTATTEIYTLSLHDALPICRRSRRAAVVLRFAGAVNTGARTAMSASLTEGSRDLNRRQQRDRKSTRLNSSHLVISYAVFCLKKKKKNKTVSECIIG